MFSQEKDNQIKYDYNIYKKLAKIDTDSALFYIKRAQRNSQIQKLDNWIAKTNYGIGLCYFLKGQDSLSKEHTLNAIKIASKTHNDTVLTKSYSQLGLIYYYKNDYTSALEMYQKALNISLKNKNLDTSSISIYSNLADLMIVQEDTLNALKYYYSAKKIGENKYIKELIPTYNNLGVLYIKSNKDSAIYYLEKSLQLSSLYKQEKKLAPKYHNLAVTYLNFNSTENYPKAFKYLKSAEEIGLKTNNKRSLAKSYLYLGFYYEKAANNNKEALNYYYKSKNLMDKNTKADEYINLLKSISNLHEAEKEFKEALLFRKKYETIKDSVFSKEKNSRFQELQTKFEFEKKNLKINQLLLESKLNRNRRKTIILISSTCLFFLLGLSLLLYQKFKHQRNLRRKETLIHYQNIENFKAKEELKNIKHYLKGQKEERDRISRDLHDSISGSLASVRVRLLDIDKEKPYSFNNIIKIIETIMNDVRSLSHSLNSSFNDERTLTNILEDLFLDYQQIHKIKMDVNIYPENCLEKINLDNKNHIYRIFQELLINTAKHAKAKNVFVHIHSFEKSLSILVEDDGIGCEANIKNGLGLKSINQRIKIMNGKITFTSSNGFTVNIKIPL